MSSDGQVLGYLELIELIHSALLPRTYVEIGVEFGDSLCLALPGTRAVGIDPFPKIRRRLNRSTAVFAETSDEFFERHDLRELFSERTVDLAYIDGLHLFEYALRDFMNIERSCGRDSVILIDDTYPPDAESASRERTTRDWTGDVWKLVVCLLEHRPDLDIRTVSCTTGVTIVTGFDPTSTLLVDRYDQMLEEYADVTFAAIQDHKDVSLKTIPPVWHQVRPLLPDRPFRVGDPRLLKLGRLLRSPTQRNLQWRVGQAIRLVPGLSAVPPARGDGAASAR